MVNPFASIEETARALRRKKVSSVELTQMYISRLKTLGAEHHAVAELTEELAMKQAKKADKSEAKSPLHGIPFGAKDLYSVANIRTRWGSPGHEDQVFPYTATCVQRLFDAGGVIGIIGMLAIFLISCFKNGKTLYEREPLQKTSG